MLLARAARRFIYLTHPACPECCSSQCLIYAWQCNRTLLPVLAADARGVKTKPGVLWGQTEVDEFEEVKLSRCL
jgi:hypothetical protein